jgi:hypothetical protein
MQDDGHKRAKLTDKQEQELLQRKEDKCKVNEEQWDVIMRVTMRATMMRMRRFGEQRAKQGHGGSDAE